MCICIEMFIAALVYVYNEFFPLPNFIEIIAQISWIGVHGKIASQIEAGV